MATSAEPLRPLLLCLLLSGRSHGTPRLLALLGPQATPPTPGWTAYSLAGSRALLSEDTGGGHAALMADGLDLNPGYAMSQLRMWLIF